MRARRPRRPTGGALPDGVAGPARELLRLPRLERAIGVIYRPETERLSQYFHAQLSKQLYAVLHFDEFTEQGSLGYATFATPDKGRRIFEAAAEAATMELSRFADGFVLVGIEPRS